MLFLILQVLAVEGYNNGAAMCGSEAPPGLADLVLCRSVWYRPLLRFPAPLAASPTPPSPSLALESPPWSYNPAVPALRAFRPQIKDTAKAMVSSGMKDAGYEWIVLDDCWHPSRNSNGTLSPAMAKARRPLLSGMVPVIDYVHSLGLKFGWSPGSYGHYEVDANTFAAWGVDYVKACSPCVLHTMDYCGLDDSPQGHQEFSKALNATGRQIAFELCRGPYQKEDHWGYAPGVAQVWRATGDHHDEFSSTMDQVNSMKGKSKWSGPYGWAYGDMMMTGGQGCANWNASTPQHCPGQTDNEYRTEVSLYAVISSPMMVGTDIRKFTPIMNETLLNTEMLAINQDYLATPGDAVTVCGGTEVWARHLSDGRVAVAMPNLGSKKQAINLCFADLGLTGQVSVRDVWAKKDAGLHTGNYSSDVDTHDTALLILSKQ
eukprot:gene11582-2108_t